MTKIPLNWPEHSCIALDLVLKDYARKNVLVTGGASFIGSHLVEALLALGANVRVLDDLSSGRSDNLDLKNSRLDFVHENILQLGALDELFSDFECVFHLAAIHGGRGFIETKQIEILRNLAIDNAVFNAAVKARVPKITYASSACAYPTSLQSDLHFKNHLSEMKCGALGSEFSHPDGIYGWTKLVGEFQLKSYVQLACSRGRAVRIFTAYGERENESHAPIALIAKALLKLDPFPIWGDGRQMRNFTYVTDIVAGLLLAGSFKPREDYALLNVGTSSHHSVNELVDVIFGAIGWRPRAFDYQTDKPSGVLCRASDNEMILTELDWEPRVGIEEGIARTVAWYSRKVDRPKTPEALELVLETR